MANIEIEYKPLYVSIYDATEHSFTLYELTEEQTKELHQAKDKKKYIKENLYCNFGDDCGLDISDKAAIYVEKSDGSQESMEFGEY